MLRTGLSRVYLQATNRKVFSGRNKGFLTEGTTEEVLKSLQTWHFLSFCLYLTSLRSQNQISRDSNDRSIQDQCMLFQQRVAIVQDLQLFPHNFSFRPSERWHDAAGAAGRKDACGGGLTVCACVRACVSERAGCTLDAMCRLSLPWGLMRICMYISGSYLLVCVCVSHRSGRASRTKIWSNITTS